MNNMQEVFLFNT